MKIFRNNTWTYMDSEAFLNYSDDFTSKNQRKAKLMRRWNIWTAKKLPDEIKHYEERNGVYKIPMGAVSFLPNITISEYNNQVFDFPELANPLFDYQKETVDKALSLPCGLIHASTGSGKTYMICEMARRLKRKTLIVVHNLTQMGQMVQDVQNILGFFPYYVCGKAMKKKELQIADERITILNIDSHDKIEDYTQFGTILIDECDCMLNADKRRDWVGTLSPEFMYSFTGTTELQDFWSNVFRAYCGVTTTLHLHRLTPKYERVLSTFQYELDDLKDFHELKKAMYADETRNNLIVNTVLEKGKGRKGIVFCDSVDHAKFLVETLQKKGVKTYLMIGEVSNEEREIIRKEAKEYQGDLVIVGSARIIGRWFDLPELSYAVFTIPEKFNSSILQYIGRIIRPFEGKGEPVFYDIVDFQTNILNNQAKSRLATYKKSFTK